MRTVTITADIVIPEEVPKAILEEDILIWIQFEMGERGGIRTDNPLSGYELEAINIKIQ